MEQKINTILEDLYAIDPTFRAHETELRKVVSDLLVHRPDTRFDSVFAARLRTDLMAAGRVQAVEKRPVQFHYWFSRSISTFGYSFIGALVAVLVVAPLTYFATIKSGQTSPFALKNVMSGLSQKQQINERGINAFGPIALMPQSSSNSLPASDVRNGVAAPTVPTATGSESQSFASADAASPGSTAYPEIIKYVYEGEPLKLSKPKGTVLKRTKGIQTSNSLIDLIQKADFALVDIASYKNTTLRNLEVAENQPDGYSISINFAEGFVNITSNASAISAREGEPLRPDEIPSNDELVSIADSFLKKHGISTSIYGKPIVENTAYVITYPLILKGKPVYDEGGFQVGMQVSVDIRTKRVTAINGLASQVYEASQYDLEQDPVHVLDAATKSYIYDGSARVRTVKLGTPQEVYMRHWSYSDARVETDELYIPALLFPVKNPASGYDFRNVIVPLVKNFANNNRPVPIPMPASTVRPSN